MFEINGMVEKPPKGTALPTSPSPGATSAAGDFQDPGERKSAAPAARSTHRRHDRLAKTQKFYGVEFEGERHDCGSKSGFLRANIAFGMARADLREGCARRMKRYLEK